MNIHIICLFTHFVGQIEYLIHFHLIHFHLIHFQFIHIRLNQPNLSLLFIIYIYLNYTKSYTANQKSYLGAEFYI